METTQNSPERMDRVSSLLEGVSLDDILAKNTTNEELKETLNILKKRLDEYEQLKYKHNELGQAYAQSKKDYATLKDVFDSFQQLYKEEHKHSRKLEDQVICDDLTGVYNQRHLLKNEIPLHIKYALRDKRPFSLIVFDVDNFKAVNDSRGHSKGDSLLKEVAAVMRKNIAERDIAFRYGGDEFVVLCPDTSESEAEVLADRLCKTLKSETIKKNLRVSVSMGISQYDAKNKLHIFDCADKNMYLAKNLGRGCYVTDSFAKTLD
ncbi:unnamed protein product [marine sediment metagenome]|uniref:GGDEF domain-containing protein n=1 Tax=marine sediment metagenome TaxID=412755 RepID=X0RY48_9ZZZZ